MDFCLNVRVGRKEPQLSRLQRLLKLTVDLEAALWEKTTSEINLSTPRRGLKSEETDTLNGIG